jgi:hypothetical protein
VTELERVPAGSPNRRARPFGSIRRLARWAFSAVGLIVAASVGIGYAPAGGFDWTVFALVFTALSTLVLALSTGALALSTWQDVRETTRLVDATVTLVEVSADEVELSRRAIEAEVKPLIVDWPADNRQVTVKPGSEEGAVRIVVPAVNANATALIQGVTMHWYEPGAAISPTTYIGWASVLAVGPGGETEAWFHFDAAQAPRLEPIEQQGKFWVEIDYTDAAGGQRDVTRFDIYRDETADEWRVWAVSFRHAGESEPYAKAQPTNR